MAIKKNKRPESSRPRLRRNRILTVGVILLALLCGLAGLAFARYMQSSGSGVVARAGDFYFTSDLLDENGKEYTLVPGSTSVTFTLGNHGDGLRYSEMDIEYEVTVDNGATISIETNTKDNSQKLTKEKISDAKVTISGLTPGNTYKVTAVGTGGYTKKLTATIVVPEQEAQIYQYLDQSADEYSLLTVWNEGDEAGNVTITYTGIPDNTNPNMTTWRTNGSPVENIRIAPHESKIFRFFNGTATASNAAPKDLTRKRSVQK